MGGFYLTGNFETLCTDTKADDVAYDFRYKPEWQCRCMGLRQDIDVVTQQKLLAMPDRTISLSQLLNMLGIDPKSNYPHIEGEQYMSGYDPDTITLKFTVIEKRRRAIE